MKARNRLKVKTSKMLTHGPKFSGTGMKHRMIPVSKWNASVSDRKIRAASLLASLCPAREEEMLILVEKIVSLKTDGHNELFVTTPDEVDEVWG